MQAIPRQFPARQLSRLWLSGFLTDHYKFKLPLPTDTINNSSVTVILRFSEALTGKTFEIQKLLSLGSLSN